MIVRPAAVFREGNRGNVYQLLRQIAARHQGEIIEADLERLNYQQDPEDHLPIGSGTVESACKTWSPRG